MIGATDRAVESRVRGSHDGRRKAQASAPVVSAWMLRSFEWYVRRYLQTHFDRVLLDRGGSEPSRLIGERPLVVYLNHASWWDPLIGLIIARTQFPQRQHFAPIDAKALEQFRFFSRLGFFGVEQQTRAGAAQFWSISTAVLQSHNAALWITPQAAFADPRVRPVHLAPGLARLASRLDGVTILPMAIEYPFWNERLPVALARFGEPLLSDTMISSDEWQIRLSSALEETQDELAEFAMSRDFTRGTPVIRGRRRVSVFYDAWRRVLGRSANVPLVDERGSE